MLSYVRLKFQQENAKKKNTEKNTEEKKHYLQQNSNQEPWDPKPNAIPLLYGGILYRKASFFIWINLVEYSFCQF